MAYNKHRWQDKYFGKDKEEESGRRMGDRQIKFEDKEGRAIKISPGYGLQVEDAEGAVIHDTPDCLIASDMNYGGHVYFQDAGNYFADHTITHETTGAAAEEYSTLHNTNLTTYLPSDLTNVNGVILNVYNSIDIDDECCDDDTRVTATVHYCNTYNSSNNSTYNRISHLRIVSQSASGDNQDLDRGMGMMAIAPVVYDSTTPYLTWWNQVTPALITTATGYNVVQNVQLYLLGFLV
jgi:hypothetical protein